ncbi:GTP-binding protein lepA [Thermodesulfobium narugense DSM 14796]|uniref:Elongation factor 4 n=1 Tax=Thermodesulfobium narugense DSM 14796 TaxID=747365 RepID=M1E4Y6_9BACT|nr:translation elongation factor 4 [Thermodesulfobium narugense]AEE13846.1 GTP-binding protein lepA [Thermodesulfobium narugense DSM 14796]
MDNIRNFSIIAHVDHGKSTLADRILVKSKIVNERKLVPQMLDNMDIERERGITIKARTVRLDINWNGKDYILNLIDTPGHVDFSYEVSRSLAACEGAILLVDATQGIEAQTLAHGLLAIEQDLVLIPVINKVDLPTADVGGTKKEIIDVFGFSEEEIILASAKEGKGIDEIISAVIERIPAPKGNAEEPLSALIFDSHYDSYRGVVAYVRVFEGEIKKGINIKLHSTGKIFEVQEIGYFRIEPEKTDTLRAGEVGYVAANIKNIEDARVGDTIEEDKRPTKRILKGFKPPLSMVFCGLYPINTDEYNLLKDAIMKLKLNDASLVFEPETSAALGFGFRCGFLGMLHMEVTIERIKREFDIDLIITPPSVVFEAVKQNNEIVKIHNPLKMPDPGTIVSLREPYVKVSIFSPAEYIGAIMELCSNKRGNYIDMEYLDVKRVIMRFEMPLSEIILDFFPLLKTKTRGYASLDYEFIGYRESDLVRLDILVNREKVDALSSIVHRSKAQEIGSKIVSSLKRLIPRHMFEIPIQAAVGSKILARENIAAMKKNVLQKCYGGDITRKRKLLEKQKEGKKKMKMLGDVQIPQEVFFEILKNSSEQKN